MMIEETIILFTRCLSSVFDYEMSSNKTIYFPSLTSQDKDNKDDL